MDRTYNIQTDVGMLVTSTLLNVKLKDFRIEQMIDNEELIDKMTKIANLPGVNVANGQLNGWFNYSKDQQKTKKVLQKNMSLFLNGTSDDNECIICNERKVNYEIDLGRNFFYDKGAGKEFINFSNMLSGGFDICPHCLMFSAISILATECVRDFSDDYNMLIETDNDEFLESYINELISERLKKAMLKDITEEAPSKKSTPEFLINTLIKFYNEKRFDNDIEVLNLILFANNKGKQKWRKIEMNGDKIKFLAKLDSKNLLHDILNLKIRNEYISKYPYTVLYPFLYDNVKLFKYFANFYTMELKVDKEIINIYEKEMLDVNIVDTINIISDKILEIYPKDKIKKEIKELNTVENSQEMRQKLMSINKDYFNSVNGQFLTMEQMNILLKNSYETRDYLILKLIEKIA